MPLSKKGWRGSRECNQQRGQCDRHLLLIWFMSFDISEVLSVTLQLTFTLSESHSSLHLQLSFLQLVSLSEIPSVRLVIHRSPYDIHVTGQE